MITILGFDGLEYNLVRKFNLEELLQESFGTTDLSEFREPRTIVLWSSFLAGKNLEKKILSKPNLWDFKLKPEDTFFSHFKNHQAIDVPGYTYIKESHNKERKVLKAFFEKKATLEDYDKIAFSNHKNIKKQFFKALNQNYDILMGYFNLADAIGHLSFGMEPKMKIIYQELAEIAKTVKRETRGPVLIISDHGMKPVGRFGDHSKYGFWSLNLNLELKKPKITQFYKIIVNLK